MFPPRPFSTTDVVACAQKVIKTTNIIRRNRALRVRVRWLCLSLRAARAPFNVNCQTCVAADMRCVMLIVSDGLQLSAHVCVYVFLVENVPPDEKLKPRRGLPNSPNTIFQVHTKV